MSSRVQPRISREDLNRLRTFRIWPNLTKIPLVIALMAALGWFAWTTGSWVVEWAAYIALGYLWMSMVTFMHDATHNSLFRSRALNWVFGIVTMIPIFASFIAFKEDHLQHHRFNRSPRDPDAFTMGKRGVLDFLLFYAYLLIGGVLSFLHFNFLYPFGHFDARQWAVHLFETALKIATYWLVLDAAADHGVLGKALALWLWPILFFSLFNSMRFIAEHYGTPWDAGQMSGSRTVISNPVQSFFWNNINWHIGHHVYPNVPWYNLIELHRLLEPQIAASGALVDRSYLGVYIDAIRKGPETEARLAQHLLMRAQNRAQADSAAACRPSPG